MNDFYQVVCNGSLCEVTSTMRNNDKVIIISRLILLKLFVCKTLAIQIHHFIKAWFIIMVEFINYSNVRIQDAGYYYNRFTQ